MSDKIRFSEYVIDQINNCEFDICTWTGPLWLQDVVQVERFAKEDEVLDNTWLLRMTHKVFSKNPICLFRYDSSVGRKVQLNLTAEETKALRKVFEFAREVQQERNITNELEQKAHRERLEWYP